MDYIIISKLLKTGSRLSMKTSLENDYKIIMMLIIRNFTRDNFGGYRCVVRNSLGETDGLIRLYGDTFKKLLLSLRKWIP